MAPEQGAGGGVYVMPSPLALGGLGQLQCASTDRLALLSTPKERRRSGLRAARPGTVPHPMVPLTSAYGRSQSARGAERPIGGHGSARIGAQGPAGVPRTAPGSARSHGNAGRPNSHGFSMHYRRLEPPQSASVPAPNSCLPRDALVPQPPARPSLSRFQRPQLAPLLLHSSKQRGTKKRTPHSEVDCAATINRGRSGERKLQPANDQVPDITQETPNSTSVSANWKQVQLHEQIRVLSKAPGEDEKWDALLKPWLTKYDKARRWPGSIEERLQSARQEQKELREREAARLNELNRQAHRRLEEIQFLGTLHLHSTAIGT
jgi:hypothetical protein